MNKNAVLPPSSVKAGFIHERQLRNPVSQISYSSVDEGALKHMRCQTHRFRAGIQVDLPDLSLYKRPAAAW